MTPLKEGGVKKPNLNPLNPSLHPLSLKVRLTRACRGQQQRVRRLRGGRNGTSFGGELGWPKFGPNRLGLRANPSLNPPARREAHRG